MEAIIATAPDEQGTMPRTLFVLLLFVPYE